jgi:hypothetical protein
LKMVRFRHATLLPAKDASVNQTIGLRLAIKIPGASLVHSKSLLGIAA